VLVVGGLQQAWPAVVIEDLSHRPRTVVLPLMGDDSRIGLPGYRDFIYRADVVCAISGPERERILAIDELMRVPEVREVPIAFPVNARAAAERVAGLSRFDHYVLFLRGFPRGTVPYSLVPDYARVRRTLNDAGIADVSHEAWRTFGEGFEYEVAVSPSRVNLWRLMSHAIATVDLRPGNLLGREVIESLLVGTPVLVPSGSWMRTLVEESGGGSAFASEDELIDQLARLEPPARHRQVADVGREWAQRKHGDHARFVAELTAVVLGDEDEMRSAV
jgi:hypothetical protein